MGGERRGGGSRRKQCRGGSKEEEKNSLSVRVTIIRNAIHFVHDYVSIQSFISFNLHSCLLT